MSLRGFATWLQELLDCSVSVDFCDPSAAFGLIGRRVFSRAPVATMPAQLTVKEQFVIERTVRNDQGTAMDAFSKINSTRAKNGIEAVTKCTVYRFIKGKTHVRGRSETRGRAKVLSKGDIRHLDKVRKGLLKEVDSERRVTWNTIQAKAGLGAKCCNKVVQQALRSEGVRFRAPRAKILLTEDDAKQRLKVARTWVKFPTSFWTQEVHAYVDNKAWPLPLSPAQKKRLQKSRVTGHLRKASEGVDRGCTKPRLNHSFLGIPSVTITAAVAKNRIIMWHVVGKQWNGSAAADMYAGPLLRSLERTWGEKRQYTIVEDGDRKGNQSRKGIAAKKHSNIRAMTLPPRTPSWMPLDFAIWAAIAKAMEKTDPATQETKAKYLERLARCARSLPRGFVSRILGRMKTNVQGVIDARGFHPKND